MKARKNDIAVHIRISGPELLELKKCTGEMSEAFGLDEKIFNYKGSRQITLYRWDMDCILAAIASAIVDKTIYPDPDGVECIALHSLLCSLNNEYTSVYGNKRRL